MSLCVDFFQADFGSFAVLWRTNPFRIVSVELPPLDRKALMLTATPKKDARVTAWVSRWREVQDSSDCLSCMDWKGLGSFHKKVLLTLHANVPKGRVVTYAGLAIMSGSPKAFRAVGGAMARNPFPLFIPCHRTIGGARALGGFQQGSAGGLILKRQMLESEGVRFDSKGRILSEFILPL